MPIESSGDKSLVIHPKEGVLDITVPIRWIRTKGRRRIHSPSDWVRPIVDETLRSFLVKAHHWQRQLLKGKVTSIQALAKQEGMDKSDMSKILRLTTLAPDIQSDLLLRTGQWPLSWLVLKRGFPQEWQAQRAYFEDQMQDRV